MLPREFTEEQTMFRETYRKFLAAEIVPHMELWREQGRVDPEAFRKAGEQGLLMVWPAEKYGGIGDDDFRFEQIIIEETAYARCGDWYNTLHSRLVAPYFTRFGSEQQCEKFLPRCVSGEAVLAIAMTEPDAGSDLAGMRTTAVEADDHWVINGSKTYISNGINADIVILAAKTDPQNNPHHMTLFIVERGMTGFERGRNLKKMGLLGPDRRVRSGAQGLRQTSDGLSEHPVQAGRVTNRARYSPDLCRSVRGGFQCRQAHGRGRREG